MSSLHVPLSEIRDVVMDLAKEAGQIILSANPSEFDNKKNTVDIVTETDKAVESLISSALKAKYPSFKFIGEETYTPGTTITDDPTFIVDPIDGTSNFVHGFPAVCVSIGLVVEKQPTIGIVYNPFLDELYTAVKGSGAFVHHGSKSQKLPLRNSPLRGLGPACIGIEWGSDREGVNFELNLKVFTTLARTKATGGRIAAGQQDMFWECGCWAWDVAAAWCILNEAGGMIVDGHPGNWYPPIDNRRYLAVRAAPAGQKEIVEQFWGIIGEDRSTYGPS
ncbi:uncharacterized protein N0V89_004534 [Didymosphaeria variabile]|uniref:Inositol-1-monophosphatase n=1 Tax=Didymosphaeria variabile TaxID=1932322 RepID=A0A9W9CDB0_9PLEO|nr:uncharacterized protein N0V89_004534 [Didymosphaeria variabile]KAJ4356500.1 hypothetical protein N0V89_004534 [Didymosphaeria variabile]